eukprot:2111334-Amphidinium_carterae.1
MQKEHDSYIYNNKQLHHRQRPNKRLRAFGEATSPTPKAPPSSLTKPMAEEKKLIDAKRKQKNALEEQRSDK